MRHFKIPFDLNHEEKIIGGYLTLKQGIYAAIFGALVLCSLVLPLGGNLADLIMGKISPSIVIIKITFAIIFVVSGLLFMYLKPLGIPFMKYLFMRITYARRNKKIYFKKMEV